MHPDIDIATAQLEEVLHQSPRLFGLSRSNWWLDGLRQVIGWMAQLSLAGISKLLRRLGLVYKRGRQHVHSPDLLYQKTMALVGNASKEARANPKEVVLLYEDELTYYAFPKPARAYSLKGDKGRKATGSILKPWRIAACLDVVTGAVIARQRSGFGKRDMKHFLGWAARQYPHAKRIYIALDTWPVHFQPEVLDYLREKYPRVHLLSLPTYAPWTNPTEKVWLKLSRELLDQHPYGKDWPQLKQAVTDWLLTQRSGSEQMLRFTGLLSH